VPIVQPGKRPAKRFAASRILGGKIVQGRRSTNADLNVVPMVDMMTMLVIFLLQQFSATGEVLYMQKDIKLPDARHGQQIEVAPVVAISSAQVVVSGQKVAEVTEVEKDPSQIIAPLVEKLRDEKKRWDFIHQNDRDREKNWKGEVNVPRSAPRHGVRRRGGLRQREPRDRRGERDRRRRQRRRAGRQIADNPRAQ
jgi:biopolymer transport protein ExbD